MNLVYAGKKLGHVHVHAKLLEWMVDHVYFFLDLHQCGIFYFYKGAQ